MNRALLLALSALFLPGCLLLPPGQIFPFVDDDDSAGDDDDAADDDDVADDDDSTDPELPPCAFDASLPGVHDSDGDGWPVQSQGDGGSTDECDCDDEDPNRYPGAPEVLFDLKPDDCDSPVEVLVGTDEPTIAGSSGIIEPPNTSTFGSAISWGQMAGEAAADVCIRSGAWVYVLFDPAARLGDPKAGAPVEGAIGPFAPFGSVDCAHDVDGDGDGDIVVNAWSGSNGAARGIFVYSGANLPATDFVIDDTEADFSWNGGTALPIGSTVGTCLGVGDLQSTGAAGDDTAEILVGLDGAATIGYTVLSADGPGSDLQEVDQWSRAAVQAPEAMDCFVVGDLDGRGLDEMVLGDPTVRSRLRFTEDGFGATEPNDVPFEFRVRAALSLDTDGDGDLELALGVPGASVGGNTGTGLVGLIRGGLTTPEWNEVPEGVGDALFNPNHAVNFVDNLGDANLGRALCDVGDIDGDGRDELVMTAPGVGSGWVGEARLYTGRGWDRWADVLSDVSLAERETEATRFEAPAQDDAFGAMSRCASPDAARTSHVFFGAPALTGDASSSGGIYWWANETPSND